MAVLTCGFEDEDLSLLEGSFLVQVSGERLYHILRGNVPVPLEAESLAIW